MIVDNVVCGGAALKIPGHLSFGQHVIDSLKEICANGDRVALVNHDTGHQTTFRQLLQQTVSVATGLEAMGIEQRTIVGICSENTNEYIPAVLGAVCFGATVTAFNTIYTEDEMRHVLNISRPSVIFASEEGLKRHLKIFKSMTFIERIIQLNGTVPAESDLMLFSTMMVETDASQYEPVDVKGCEDVLFILYSSGTTGLPKGVMLTHFNALYAAASLDYGYTREVCTKFLTVLPWYHSYGIFTTLHYLLCKKTMVYLKRFSAEKYLGAIEEHMVNVLLTAPPVIVCLTKSHLVQEYNMSSVNAIWSGAAPLSAETTQELLKRMPNCKSLVQGYGMTELTLASIKDHDDVMFEKKHRPGSCGYPVPGLKVKVVNIETRQKLKAHEDGELCIKGPVAMKGYLGNEAATRDVIDEEGYLKTGDIGHYDDHGYFFIVDRLKELIKYKGHQVSPVAVERVVLQHVGVAECGVVGAPDELAGELPTAFVVAKPGAALTQTDLLRFTNDRLSPVSRLRGGIIFTDEIPKSPSGKILRRVLKQKLQEHISVAKHASHNIRL